MSKKKKTEHMIDFIKNLSVKPEEINEILIAKGSSPVSQSMKLFKLFSRPQLAFKDISSIESVANYLIDNNVMTEIIEQVEIQVKYSGYIDKESSNAEKLNALENISIPKNFDYSRLKCLSSEAKSKYIVLECEIKKTIYTIKNEEGKFIKNILDTSFDMKTLYLDEKIAS